MKMSNSPLMTFGKYKDQPIKDVIAKDPRYCLWAHKNVSYFKMSTEQVKFCIQQSPKKYITSPDDDEVYLGLDYSDFGNN